jgi:hypothetical protein
VRHWWLEILGQPPSLNHAYHPTVLRVGGRTIHTISKTKEAEAYQIGITRKADTEKPSGWLVPTGFFVRMHFWYFLNPDIDCDNVKKLVIDAISLSVPTDKPNKFLNDRWVLTCDVAKYRVPRGHQRLVVEISLETTESPHHSTPTGIPPILTALAIPVEASPTTGSSTGRRRTRARIHQ